MNTVVHVRVRRQGGLGAVRRRLRPVVPHALRGPRQGRAAPRRRLRVRLVRALAAPLGLTGYWRAF